jgi:4-carboxymuconolactone decarboxylase
MCARTSVCRSVNRQTESLVALSAALAADVSHWGSALDNAQASADSRAVEEVLLQSYLFLGFPVAIQALGAWRKRMPLPVSGQGGGESSGDGAGHGADETDWRKRGEEICAAVYGEKYALLREHVAALHPDLDDWMIAEGYGKVLGRPGLDLRTRELCAVAILAGIHAPKQLHAHLRGAMNVGATNTDIEIVLDLAGNAQGPARRAAAARVWHQVQTMAYSEAGTARRVKRGGYSEPGTSSHENRE